MRWQLALNIEVYLSNLHLCGRIYLLNAYIYMDIIVISTDCVCTNPVKISISTNNVQKKNYQSQCLQIKCQIKSECVNQGSSLIAIYVINKFSHNQFGCFSFTYYNR